MEDTWPNTWMEEGKGEEGERESRRERGNEEDGMERTEQRLEKLCPHFSASYDFISPPLEPYTGRSAIASPVLHCII